MSITYTETKRYAEDRHMFLTVLQELENLGLLVSTLENDYELGVTHRVWRPNMIIVSKEKTIHLVDNKEVK